MSSRTSDTISAGQAHSSDTEKGLNRERSSQDTDQAGADEERSAMKEADKDMVSDKYQVTLDQEDDPLCFSVWRKWIAVLIVSSGALCAVAASSMAGLYMLSRASFRLMRTFRLLSRRSAFPMTCMSGARLRFSASVCSQWGLVRVIEIRRR